CRRSRWAAYSVSNRPISCPVHWLTRPDLRTLVTAATSSSEYCGQDVQLPVILPLVLGSIAPPGRGSSSLLAPPANGDVNGPVRHVPDEAHGLRYGCDGRRRRGAGRWAAGATPGQASAGARAVRTSARGG